MTARKDPGNDRRTGLHDEPSLCSPFASARLPMVSEQGSIPDGGSEFKLDIFHKPQVILSHAIQKIYPDPLGFHSDYSAQHSLF